MKNEFTDRAWSRSVNSGFVLVSGGVHAQVNGLHRLRVGGRSAVAGDRFETCPAAAAL